MTGENVALNLLNRTKYAQNRTKYYTVRNTVLSQTERPLFITGSLQDVSINKKSLYLRKSFINRRSSKRGPFQKLSLPHVYFKTLGDPLYYSNQEIVSACVTASSDNMCDSYFWKQICEKIREVRDVIPITDLLKCLNSLTKVNYYDRDLLRLLSREFVDDISKLSLDDISQLLCCYYKHNVYSCDLVNSSALRVISILNNEFSVLNIQNNNTGSNTNADTTNTNNLSDFNDPSSTSSVTNYTKSSGFFGKLKDIIPSNKSNTIDYSFRPISKILKYCHYFNYSNPNFYLLISSIFISNSNNMDIISKLEMFTYLDPKKLSLVDDIANLSDTDSNTTNLYGYTDSSICSSYSTNLLNSILNSFDTFDSSQLYHINSFNLSTFLSSHIFKNSDNCKLLNDLCSICSTCNLISSSILRYLSNCYYLNIGYHNSLDTLFTLLSNYTKELLPIMSNLSSLDQSNTTNSSSFSISGSSPFILSLQHIFIDSLLTCNHVLNTCWRLKLGYIKPPETNNPNPSSTLSFTLNDNNIHSSFLREFAKLSFSETELGLLSIISSSLNIYGCKGQSVKNLSSAFESFTGIVSNKNSLSLPFKLIDDITKSIHLLSLEIIRQLIDFDTDSLYRISLSLNLLYSTNISDSGSTNSSFFSISDSSSTSKFNSSSYLHHYLKSFPKLTRRKCDSNSVTFSNPFTSF